MTNIETVKLLKELIEIPSLSGDELRAATHVYDWAKGRDLFAEWRGPNIVIRLGNGNGKRLLLNSHLDTIAPLAGWETDPFAPLEKDGKIIGLGANDAKGCVASILGAASRLRDAKLSGEVVIALTVEEETGKSRRGLKTLMPELGNIDAAVIGEPTSLSICTSQKGLLILDVETQGKARHAAHAHRIEGKNAVVEAARAIIAIDGLKVGSEHPKLGFTTCNVTKIDGGKSHNVIPERCTFRLDIRTVPGVSNEEIIREIELKTGADVKIYSDGFKFFETKEDELVVRAALCARPNAKTVGSSTMSDAAWTRHLPTIKAGPGDTSRSHTPGEYIEVKELDDGVTFYERMVREYFL